MPACALIYSACSNRILVHLSLQMPRSYLATMYRKLLKLKKNMLCVYSLLFLFKGHHCGPWVGESVARYEEQHPGHIQCLPGIWEGESARHLLLPLALTITPPTFLYFWMRMHPYTYLCPFACPSVPVSLSKDNMCILYGLCRTGFLKIKHILKLGAN